MSRNLWNSSKCNYVHLVHCTTSVVVVLKFQEYSFVCALTRHAHPNNSGASIHFCQNKLECQETKYKNIQPYQSMWQIMCRLTTKPKKIEKINQSIDKIKLNVTAYFCRLFVAIVDILQRDEAVEKCWIIHGVHRTNVIAIHPLTGIWMERALFCAACRLSMK